MLCVSGMWRDILLINIHNKNNVTSPCVKLVGCCTSLPTKQAKKFLSLKEKVEFQAQGWAWLQIFTVGIENLLSTVSKNIFLALNDVQILA